MDSPVQPVDTQPSKPEAPVPSVAKKDPNALVDEVSGQPLERPWVVLKDELGDNHYFQDWNSVVKWAQTNAETA